MSEMSPRQQLKAEGFYLILPLLLSIWIYNTRKNKTWASCDDLRLMGVCGQKTTHPERMVEVIINPKALLITHKQAPTLHFTNKDALKVCFIFVF